jgi:SAM-dependent methyltransferase
MATYLQRTLSSPRWQWLNKLVGPFFFTGGPEDQWLRVVMNRETAKLIAGIEPQSKSALEISGHHWDQPELFHDYTSTEALSDYDVCKRPLDQSFDVILAEQVFEHLLWPYRAGRNVYDMLNSGGYFLITTPFLVKVHNYPIDCSRWTETGLKHLLAECGFPLDDIQTGSWGNRSCLNANFGTLWPIYVPWLHSLKNEPDFPVAIWALAKKP